MTFEPDEGAVRGALRRHLDGSGQSPLIEEFWVPRSHERADLVVLGEHLAAFEIKTGRDTLRRLERQVGAYGRLFDTCALIVAERHSADALSMIPSWWGCAISVANQDSISFDWLRAGEPNPKSDPETVVRLLWRDEVQSALEALGSRPDASSGRASMWEELLGLTDPTSLRAIVLSLLRKRHLSGHRNGKRFVTQPLPLHGMAAI